MVKIPERYSGRLMGLIPVERIVTWQIPRPPKSLLQELLTYDSLTPTISDILDSMGITGAIPGSALRPVIPGRKIAGPAITLKYVPERLTSAQSFHEKARAKLADRDAYALSEPGDVVVIDGGGRGDISAMGGLSTLVAKKYGLAGNIDHAHRRVQREGLPLCPLRWFRGMHRMHNVRANLPRYGY